MKSVFEYRDYREYMRDFYESRKKCSAFTWREFAKLAGFSSSGFLKLVCDGKTRLSKVGVEKVLSAMNLSGAQAKKQWCIDLGDVRESARVYLNGQFIGCAWAVPFVLDCGNALRKGANELRIEVTNLPANRIAHLDRQGIVWRKFNEINVVDLNYQKTTYAHWQPVPSGLHSKVTLQEKTNQ